MRGWFVTGTDTGIGKTWVSVALLHALRTRGLRVAGMKPVASGCTPTPEGLRNDDALRLQQAASVPAAYERVNPYALEPAIAPHIAAQRAGVVIDLERIADVAESLARECDQLIVEGVGGWLVPLNSDETVGDLALRLDLPVILVVGIRLGCINHALLTAESIHRSGLPLAGWVANMIDPHMEAVTENVRDLALRIDAPFLGVIPFLHGRPPSVAAQALNTDPLFTR